MQPTTPSPLFEETFCTHVALKVLMTHTGLFEILTVTPYETDGGAPLRISACSFRCNNCNKLTDSEQGALTHVPGGIVLQCAHCKKRQAISEARFDGLADRLRRTRQQD